MTLTQIEYILAIESSNSFVEAAAKCFVTQPALTSQVKNLEEELGVVLFDRTKKPIEPTDIGREILKQAREVYNQAKRIPDLVSEYNKTVKGDLCVGIIPTISPFLVPLFINRFNDTNPAVNISIREEITENIILKLKKGELDAGIIATPVETTGIISIPLYYERFFAYVSKSSTDFYRDSVNVANLEVNDIWLLKEGNCFRNQVINICKEGENLKFRDHFHFESHSIDSLKRIVEVKNGMTLIPELCLPTIEDRNKEMVKPLGDNEFSREVSIVVTRQYLKRRVIDKLKESILETLPGTISRQPIGEIVDTNISV